MKKKLAVLALAAICGLNAATFVGCEVSNGTTHTHENKFYTVKQATCTVKGLMEVLCSTCGEKSYQEIQPVGHKIADGICTICGYVESVSEPDSEPDSTPDSTPDGEPDSTPDSTPDTTPDDTPEVQPTDPTDFSAFYSFDDLYAKTGLLNFVVSEEDFYSEIYNLELKDIYINSLGFLKAYANGEYYNLGSVQKEYVFSKATVDENIRMITVEGGVLKVVYTTGSIVTIGVISKDAKSVDDKTKELLDKGYSLEYVSIALMEKASLIIGVTVNKENQVFVRMGDNRIVSLGNIMKNQEETSDSVLIYREKDDGYEIIGTMDNTVESITLPPTHLGRDIVGIGNQAFANCQNLKEVDVMSGITDIGSYAFSNCEILTKVTLPDTLTSLGNGVFSNCKSLTNIILPNSVTKAGISLFGGCQRLESVLLGSGVKYISAGMFRNCTSLKSIEIPEGVVNIDYMAFSGCNALTSVTFKNPNGWLVRGEEISAADLNNTAKAAVYLIETYLEYDWVRE